MKELTRYGLKAQIAALALAAIPIVGCNRCDSTSPNSLLLHMSVHDGNAAEIATSFRLYDSNHKEIPLNADVGSAYVSLKSGDLEAGSYSIESVNGDVLGLSFDEPNGLMARVDCALPGEDESFQNFELDPVTVGALAYQCRTLYPKMTCE